MTTKLSSAFKRELDLNGGKFTLTVSPEGFKLVRKGKRKGIERLWTSILNGEVGLATALNASIAPGRHDLFTMTHGAGRSQTRH
jgi:hypothetical protein